MTTEGMMPVLCCCAPENLKGFLPEDSTDLKKRECSDGTFAFDSNHMTTNELQRLPGFQPAESEDIYAGKKSWKKTWKK